MSSNTSLSTEQIVTRTMTTDDAGSEEYDRFENLTRRLVHVPKDEIDAKRRERDR